MFQIKITYKEPYLPDIVVTNIHNSLDYVNVPKGIFTISQTAWNYVGFANERFILFFPGHIIPFKGIPFFFIEDSSLV